MIYMIIIFHYFSSIFDQINAALVSRRDVFQKVQKVHSGLCRNETNTFPGTPPA